MTQDDIKPFDGQPDLGRRKFLNTAALVGLSGAGLSVGLSACTKEETPAPGKASGGGGRPAAGRREGSWRRERYKILSSGGEG
jgi:nitrous-oxide reductase